ncbi:MAG: ribose-phosphate pyrophosphokinase [Anaerolineae bacterium]|jgi:ribose-phosphate pyrophosphokinase|nr:ribose-phosphate pyrophosphokinase [Anaerolineae bacterium]MDH7474017.1 ribose-phosphate pyrophosphokinase [Anaerolineae bacterium]
MYRELSIFSGSANPELAQEICDYLNVPLRGMDIIDFPNENIFIKLHRSVRGQDVYVIQSACPPLNRNIMELLIIIDTLKRASAEQITAVMPLYPYARSDKKDQPRVPITARLIADLITVAGANRYMTIDLHAGQVQGFFSIPGDELTAFHILSDYFLQKNIPNAVVVSPDLGFAKKARNFAEKLHVPLAVIEKRRKSSLRPEALNVIGDVRGKNAILVDDEVLTGGTIVEAVEVLKANGADRIFASFTHAVLADPATERLRGLPLEEIVTTNTVTIPPEKRLPNMTILSVAPLLGEVIRRTHLGISVGEMFNE